MVALLSACHFYEFLCKELRRVRVMLAGLYTYALYNEIKYTPSILSNWLSIVQSALSKSIFFLTSFSLCSSQLIQQSHLFNVSKQCFFRQAVPSVFLFTAFLLTCSFFSYPILPLSIPKPYLFVQLHSIPTNPSRSFPSNSKPSGPFHYSTPHYLFPSHSYPSLPISSLLYHRERILKVINSQLHEEKEEITKPPTK